MRWVAVKTGTTHAVHEEATGWAQTEKHGELIFFCSRVSNEAWVKPDNGKHCKQCQEVLRALEARR